MLKIAMIIVVNVVKRVKGIFDNKSFSPCIYVICDQLLVILMLISFKVANPDLIDSVNDADILVFNMPHQV